MAITGAATKFPSATLIPLGVYTYRAKPPALYLSMQHYQTNLISRLDTKLKLLSD